MSEFSSEVHIPYLSIAEEVMKNDDSPEQYLLSLFPNATLEQIASFNLYSLSKLHDGIVHGVELCSDRDDQMSVVEAYQLGVKEGQARNDDGLI